MDVVRPIAADDLVRFAGIAANAYPAFDVHGEEATRRLAERFAEGDRDPLTHLYGLYRAGDLLGGMRLFDFTMNLFGRMTPVGGVGMVAVDLAHKKQHVARELIAFFLRHYRERGAPLAVLYPFRPDFYLKMGFGHGAKIHQYRVLPGAFPAGGDRSGVRFLARADAPALAACAARDVAATHGMIEKRPAEVEALFNQADLRLVGFFDGERLDGYLAFQYRRGESFIINDMEVREMVAVSRPALLGLLAFLNSQADQFRRVVITTHDPYFHHLLSDPRDGSERLLPSVYHQSDTSGVGLMYRVIEMPALFAALEGHDFGGVTCRLRLELGDSFLPENAGTYLLDVTDGRARLIADGQHDATLQIGVGEFSSLLMGVIPFARLARYGQAELSDAAWLPTIDRMFRADEPPQCLTRF